MIILFITTAKKGAATKRDTIATQKEVRELVSTLSENYKSILIEAVDAWNNEENANDYLERIIELITGGDIDYFDLAYNSENFKVKDEKEQEIAQKIDNYLFPENMPVSLEETLAYIISSLSGYKELNSELMDNLLIELNR